MHLHTRVLLLQLIVLTLYCLLLSVHLLALPLLHLELADVVVLDLFQRLLKPLVALLYLHYGQLETLLHVPEVA